MMLRENITNSENLKFNFTYRGSVREVLLLAETWYDVLNDDIPTIGRSSQRAVG